MFETELRTIFTQLDSKHLTGFTGKLDKRLTIRKRNLPPLCVLLVLFFFLTLGGNFSNAEEVLPEDKIFVVFRNDDPSAMSDAEHEKRVMEIFEKYHIPQTFGIIPNVVEDYHNANYTKFYLLTENQAMLNLLKKWHREGLIEIALHGYTHQTNSLHPTKENLRDAKEYEGQGGRKWLPYLYANSEGYSEFRGLPYVEQLQRISRGKQLLETWFGVPVTTFILPWNSHDKNTIRAASEAGMELVSSSLKSYNNPSSIKLYNDLLLIQHTTELDKFKKALGSARQFIKQNNKPVLITVLYHSWMLKSPEDFQLLEDIVKEVSQSEDITVMTLRNLVTKFPETIRNISLIKLKAQSETQKADKLFFLIGRDNPAILNTDFDVFSENYYTDKKRRAITLCRKFYLAIAGLGMFVSIFYLGLVKLGVIRRRFAFGSSIFAGSMFLVLLAVGYLGPSVLDPGIGAIDSIVLIFVGTISIGFIIGYFNISRVKLNNFK